jgi:predicted transcriptional regulator
MKSYTAQYVLEELNRRVSYRSQKLVAADLGFTPQFINDIIKQRRLLSDKLAESLGFTLRPDRYIRKPEGKK